MTDNWVHVTLTIPAEHVDTANRLASIFDPDTGGAATFGGCGLSPTGDAPATHYMAATVIKEQYLPALTDPDAALSALTALAEQYGREAPEQQDVEDWCSNVIVGEVEGLERVTAEDLQEGE